jgi:hypothetical protein
MFRVRCPVVRLTRDGKAHPAGSASVWKLDEAEAKALAALAPYRTVTRVTGDEIPQHVRANAERALAS